MPQMGYDMQEGTVVRWLKREGDEVKRGEIIAEIQTDKAVVEMEAISAGVLRRIVVDEGVAVPVGQLIGIIASADEPLPEIEAEIVEAPLPEQPAVSIEAPVRVPEPEVAAPALPGELRASPVARRLADEKGIDIRRITGTGPGGRITKDDVLAYEARLKEAPTAPPVAPAPAVAPAAEARPAQAVPLSRMRQAIARLTARSKQQIPHFYVSASVDMTAAMGLRQQLNQTLEEQGVRISVNDMIVRAATMALGRYPNFNAFFQEDRLQANPATNIGIAIATEEGLIVPAIMNCESKSLKQIAQASKDLVDRAQRGVLRSEEYSEGTFSISNLGMFDVDSFVAIIFPPQSAVLAVGTVRQQPVVRDNTVAIAQVMTATLSVDHRVADGAEAAQFLGEVKKLLENPVSLLA